MGKWLRMGIRLLLHGDGDRLQHSFDGIGPGIGAIIDGIGSWSLELVSMVCVWLGGGSKRFMELLSVA